MAYRDYTELYASLQKETTILTAQIRALYRELDKKYHLYGAQIPITFGFETDTLGSYTRAGHHEKEHFHFSAVTNQHVLVCFRKKRPLYIHLFHFLNGKQRFLLRFASFVVFPFLFPRIYLGELLS